MVRHPQAGLVLAAIALVLAAPTAARTKLPGTVIARATGNGAYAIAVAHGQVERPKALYARFTGRLSEATVLVECLTGGEPTAVTSLRRRPGLFRFPVKPVDAEICHVTATLSGTGRIVAELRAVR
jgi:hypothetical protein